MQPEMLFDLNKETFFFQNFAYALEGGGEEEGRLKHVYIE